MSRLTTAILAVIFCGCFIFVCGCSKEQAGERVSETRLLLDTICTITISGYDGGDEAARQLLGEAFEICEKLEMLFSVTVEGSDIWRINYALGISVDIDPRTVEVIERGIEFGELSGGMFDITIGKLSSLWDFGGSEVHIPLEIEREKARETIDFRQIAIDGNGLTLQNAGARLDLGGIAKGYIADRIAAFLTENGVKNALVDLGGDIVALGERQDSSAWRLGVRRPFGNMDEYIGVIEASDVAVVSSGVYERKFEVSGVLYHHILDPNTGMPARSDVTAATVIAVDAITGEGLSTIAVLVGSEQAQEIFEQAKGFIGAVLVLESGEIVTFGDVEFIER